LIKLPDHELQTLANIDQGDFWALIKKVVDGDLKVLEDDIRKTPKFSDEDLTEDLRYKMGGVDCLKWVLELPSEARDQLTKR
jgi:hypothetical protein